MAYRGALLWILFVVVCSKLWGATLQETENIYEKYREDKTGNYIWTQEAKLFFNTRMGEIFYTTPVYRKGHIKALPVAKDNQVLQFPVFNPHFGHYTLGSLIQSAPVEGYAIWYQGKLILEEYPKMDENQTHIWFSLTKTLNSLGIYLLSQAGQLQFTDTITQYLPELKGSFWDKVSLEDAMNMASGIGGESGMDFEFVSPKAMFQFFKTLKPSKPSGRFWAYSNANAFLLGLIIERVSGERYGDFIQNYIWQKIGAEHDAQVRMISQKLPYSTASGGFISSLRDMVRYGLVYVPHSSFSVVPSEWISLIQNQDYHLQFSPKTQKRWEELFPKEKIRAHFQWDYIFEDGDFLKSGYGGQGLYISPKKQLIIAWFMAEDKMDVPSGKLSKQQQALSLARSLAKEYFLEKKESPLQ